MNAELRNALTKAIKTIANVTSASQATECITQATDFWIEQHKGQEWHIITIDLTLTTNSISAIRSVIARKSHGILQRFTFTGTHWTNTLVIYESDHYTETWVHELAIYVGSTSGNRILNIERNDPDTDMVDLGKFKFSK